ncbi:MAG: aminotransferase class V-fold PLP-dependent enzyme [Saprospiraceae bacterium]
MSPQKHLFQLSEEGHYLNCAYMSPLLRSVEEAGIAGMQKKRNPAKIRPEDFFEEAEIVRTKFGQLVNGHPAQVAIIPSASYGLQSAISNIPPGNGTHAITVSEEFPSDFYALKSWCTKHGKDLVVIPPPEATPERGKIWNERLLEAINPDTAAVVISSIHWTNGTLFDLKKIGARCKEVGALFIVDGTQSVGSMPIDVVAFQIDALVCAAYKWLLGPYSIGLAWYSPVFNNGASIEESWLNRTNAENFAGLTNYTADYKPGAARYQVGEYSNFILLPMLHAALNQIAAWGVGNIQQYCRQLTVPLLDFLIKNGFGMEAESYRADHLFGFSLPDGLDRSNLMEAFQQNNIFVSLRSNSIRVSPHVYNSEADIRALIGVLEEASSGT